MMMNIIYGKKERNQVQSNIEQALKYEMNSVGARTIGFPSGNLKREVFTLGPGRLWCAFGRAENRPNKSYWTCFGLYDPARTSLDITVEINVGYTETDRVAGIIAVEHSTRGEYLLHTGRIGGGYPGVGSTAFLAWSDWSRAHTAEVYDGEIPAKVGILLGKVGTGLAYSLERYVHEVANFKTWVREQDGDISSLQVKIEELEAYRAEFSGRTRRKSTKETEIIFKHGEILNCLNNYLKSINNNIFYFNTPIIDLYGKLDKNKIEVYEIKTSIDRYSIYTAIGQLSVHGPIGGDAKLFLVIPNGLLPDDIQNALKSMSINIIRWTEKETEFLFNFE